MDFWLILNVFFFLRLNQKAIQVCCEFLRCSHNKTSSFHSYIMLVMVIGKSILASSSFDRKYLKRARKEKKNSCERNKQNKILHNTNKVCKWAIYVLILIVSRFFFFLYFHTTGRERINFMIYTRNVKQNDENLDIKSFFLFVWDGWAEDFFFSGHRWNWGINVV